MRRSLTLWFASLLVIAALAATSIGLASARTGATQQATLHLVKIVKISGGKFAFKPSTIKIKVGQTVTWKNTTKTQHTATANNFSFNLGPIAKSGGHVSHKFKKAGRFKYSCLFHPYMMGTVKVGK